MAVAFMGATLAGLGDIIMAAGVAAHNAGSRAFSGEVDFRFAVENASTQ
jgi:hypothetical protein